jgi:uncharacterized protein
MKTRPSPTRLSSGLALLACLFGLATAHAAGDTVRICDDKGCSDRPRSSSTFDPSVDTNPEETRRIAALSDIASKDPRAAFDLGMRYLRGDGVRQDSYLALKWLREAGEHGQLRAQSALGRLYLTGLQEMGSDPVEAERWLSMAVEGGDKDAVKLLADAREAKKDEQTRYRWREFHRKNGYGWWYAGYPYYWTWRAGYWHVY